MRWLLFQRDLHDLTSNRLQLGLWWGWQVVSVFMFAIALCLAEICSAFPTAGSSFTFLKYRTVFFDLN